MANKFPNFDRQQSSGSPATNATTVAVSPVIPDAPGATVDDVLRGLAAQLYEDYPPVTLAFSKANVVLVDSAGAISLASNTIDPSGKQIGFLSDNCAVGDTPHVIHSGEIRLTTWALVRNQPVYLDINGGITQSRPVATGRHVIYLGKALNTTNIRIDIQYLEQIY